MLTKSEILTAIRAAASANGGRPDGRHRFGRATGITEYAISRYWPTYGDAVREAGLEPNELQGTTSDVDVLDRYIALTTSLGRVPTANHLRRARAKDPSFPSLGVFERLGGREERIARALDRARSTGALDASTILEAARQHSTRHAGAVAQSAPGPAPSLAFVYLARGHSGEYKIGRTNLVDRRVAELGVDAAVAPELVHAIRTDDAPGVEAY